MKIAVVCNDTRGGVQPYVALALGLRDAGHEVRAVAPKGLVSLFEERGIAAAALSSSPEEAMKAYGFAEMNLIERLDLMMRQMPLLAGRTSLEVLAACEGAEVLTGGIGGRVAGIPVADKLGVPFVPTHLQPVGLPSTEYPGVLLAGRIPAWMGRFGIALSHRISDKAISIQFSRAIKLIRRDALHLDKPSLAVAGQPTLYGFSRRVVPVADSDGRFVTGYWQLPRSDTRRIPVALQSFLDDPRPVVSVGFGSMVGRSAQALTDIVRSAVRLAGLRAVLLTGWGGLQESDTDSNVFVAASVPHDWLFPKVRAIVHHGGAGTTGAALTAGVPNLVVPFAADQPFWGSRVKALGVGPSPIRSRDLTAEKLARELDSMVGDSAMRRRAETLGDQIRGENGVARAVEIFRSIKKT